MQAHKLSLLRNRQDNGVLGKREVLMCGMATFIPYSRFVSLRQTCTSQVQPSPNWPPLHYNPISKHGFWPGSQQIFRDFMARIHFSFIIVTCLACPASYSTTSTDSFLKQLTNTWFVWVFDMQYIWYLMIWAMNSRSESVHHMDMKDSEMRFVVLVTRLYQTLSYYLNHVPARMIIYLQNVNAPAQT